jgi:hypothetical protein
MSGDSDIPGLFTLAWELLADPIVDSTPAGQFFTACNERRPTPHPQLLTISPPDRRAQ